MQNGLQMTESERKKADLEEKLEAWVTRGIGKESLRVSFKNLKLGDDRWWASYTSEPSHS